METLIALIIAFVKETGYLGIFIMTALESTFLPVPSEITMVPAGYLVHQGEMHFAIALLCSIAGTVSGAYVNYWLSERFGRRLVTRWGKYFCMNERKMDKIEAYFRAHGPISILTGRLIPGLRHFISLPAGLARMDLKRFCLYTAVGGGLWMATLLFLGYVIGQNEGLLKEYLLFIKLGVALLAVVGGGVYLWRHKRKTPLCQAPKNQ